jgi:hypothetical protein
MYSKKKNIPCRNENKIKYMANYKVALSAEVRGVSVHNDLKPARQSQKKHGSKYKIFRWIGHVEKGHWQEMR